MNRYFAQVEYKGTNYKGFQKQKNSKQTIQQKIEFALSKVANEKISVVCAGRTDAGVHATNQIVHFDSKSKREKKSWISGTNRYLPNDISLINIGKTSDDFHARFDAKKRTYVYIIKNSEVPLGIEFDNFLWIRSRLNEKQMNKAAKKLLGEQDFSSFRASGCQSKSVIRRIYKANVTRKGNYLIFEVTANAFLLNMIRIIVGTLIKVGRSEITPEDFENIIKKRDRKLAGRTIEAKGLYFVGPEYNNLDYKVNKVFVNELD